VSSSDLKKYPELESTIRLSDVCQWAWDSRNTQSLTVPMVYVFHWFPHRVAGGWDEGPWKGMREFTGSHENRRWEPACEGGRGQRIDTEWRWLTETSVASSFGRDVYFCDNCRRAWEWSNSYE